jgi:hypothetical protein
VQALREEVEAGAVDRAGEQCNELVATETTYGVVGPQCAP